MENLYNKYRNNDDMKRILSSIREYGYSLDDDSTSHNLIHSCFASLPLPFMKSKSSGNVNLEIFFRKLISKHEKGIFKDHL